MYSSVTVHVFLYAVQGGGHFDSRKKGVNAMQVGGGVNFVSTSFSGVVFLEISRSVFQRLSELYPRL